MENEYVLSMEGISKQFPGVRALSNVKLNARKGTVHALMGENGAGKSTLMKCLIGIYAPDSGTITFKGEKLNITNTHYALSKGISMIHQELSPIPQMTVAENIYLGREPIDLVWPGRHAKNESHGHRTVRSASHQDQTNRENARA